MVRVVSVNVVEVEAEFFAEPLGDAAFMTAFLKDALSQEEPSQMPAIFTRR